MMKPSKGRIVYYTLSEQDAEQINRRRTDPSIIAEGLATEKWPAGAQAHIGNKAHAGDVLPMLIVRVWGDNETSAVNGKVELDGTDVFWATSRTQGDGAGQWREPPRV